MALVHTPDPELGKRCPDFRLPATSGEWVTSEELFTDTQAVLVMFICNHCPYVQAIESRLIELAQAMKSQPVRIVGISSNDAVKYPEDSFEKMKLKPYPFPYLYDESQKVAQAFGAVCTPDFFLYNAERKLVYRGRLDDSWKDQSQVTRTELRWAIEATIEGREIDFAVKPSMGCSLKWR